MKYKSIDLLDAAIERVIKRTLKSYYTDWKNYDRPHYMKLKGSESREDKKIILIARKYGSYLWSNNDFLEYRFPMEASEYYFKYELEHSHFYYIDLESLTLKKLTPEEIQRTINNYRSTWNAKAA